MKYKTLLGAVLITFSSILDLQAPITHSVIYRCRITAYSPKERGESQLGNHNNNIRNEIGVALSRDLLIHIPVGSKIRLPNGEIRVVDDTTHRRIKRTCDIRYYQSVSKQRKTLRKQLYVRDLGYSYIEVLK